MFVKWTNYICDFLKLSTSLKEVHVNSTSKELFLLMQNNENIRRVTNPPVLHHVLLDITIALYPLLLPPYVLLEIVDRMPFFDKVVRKTKIDLLINVKKSADRIRQFKK